MPAGSVSVATTPVSGFAPTFSTLIVYVTSSPLKTGSGESLFVTATSSGHFTTVVSKSDAPPGSRVEVVAEALLLRTPPAFGEPVMVTVLLSPAVIVPKLQVTVPELCAQAGVGLTEVKSNELGR